MKKKLLALSLIVICLATAIGGSLAYYTATGTAHNIITSGNVNIEVVEKQDQNGTLVDYPKEPITGVMPGASVSKIVSVKNTGSGDAWIRVKVGLDVDLNAHAPEQLPAGQKPDLKLFTVNFNDADWVRHDQDSSQFYGDQDNQDWYNTDNVNIWYFRQPVAPGQSTKPLFTNVSFAPEMGNAYQGCTVHVKIDAEAVQVANNPLPASGNHAEIPGWPTATSPKAPEFTVPRAELKTLPTT